MRPGISAAVARHALATNLRTPFTWAGLAVMAVVSLIGPAVSLKNTGAWGFDPDMLGTGFAFGALFAFRSGLVEQREGGLQAFLRENFVSPLEHMVAAVLSLVATWAGFVACALVLALTLSGGDVGLAFWTAWLLLLTSGLLLPFVLMVECASDLRTPLAVPGFIYFAGLFVLASAVGSHRAAALMGLNTDRAWFPSSFPLAGRAAAVLVAGFAMVVLVTWLKPRIRRSGRSGGPDPATARSTP